MTHTDNIGCGDRDADISKQEPPLLVSRNVATPIEIDESIGAVFNDNLPLQNGIR